MSPFRRSIPSPSLKKARNFWKKPRKKKQKKEMKKKRL